MRSRISRVAYVLLALLSWQNMCAAVSGFDRIIAIVNDDVIVATELDSRVDEVRAQLQVAGTPSPPYPVLQKQVQLLFITN